MNNHDHQSGNGFFNGFLLGAVIGAAVVFFLFTDKGKKLLKTIMEESSEGFSELQDLLEEEMNEEAYENEEEGLPPVQHLSTVPHSAEHTHVEPIHHEDHGEETYTTSSPKHFFKRAKK